MRPLAAIVGPTGSAKSDVAMRIADEVHVEIVSVDSMQVYRGMDIGTAKPSVEDRRRVRHHMIDVVDPAYDYTVAEFQREARSRIAEATGPVVVVGGSGLHFRAVVDPLDFAPTDRAVRAEIDALEDLEARAVLEEMDPEAAQHVDLQNPRRVTRAIEVARLTGAVPSVRARSPRSKAVAAYESELPVAAVGLDPGPGLGDRLARRFDAMLDAGLVGEVERVMSTWGSSASQAVGYRQVARLVSGEWSAVEARDRAITATRALARRQRTFFRRDPRVQWAEWAADPDTLADTVLHLLEEAGWNS